MDEHSLKASVDAYSSAARTWMAGSKIMDASERAEAMLDSINYNLGAGAYQYPSYAVDDMRRVQALLGRVVLEAIAERARQ